MSDADNAPAIEKNPRYERWRWQIFIVTWLAYVGFYLVRKATFVAAAGDLGILNDPKVDVDKPGWGVALGFYGVAYALGQVIWGPSADRFGTRKVVLIGMFGAIGVALAMTQAPAAAAFLHSPILVLFTVLLFLQGICQGTGWSPLTKNVGYWFSREERGRTYGFWSTNYAIGSTIGATVAGYAAFLYGGWRGCFFVGAGGLFVIWLLFLLFQRNRPKDVGLPPIETYHSGGCADEAAADAHAETQSARSVTWEVLKNPMILRIAAIYFLLKPLRYAIWGWGAVYISETLGTGTKDSAVLSAVFDVVGPVGVIAAGYASDKIFRTRRIPICVINLFIVAAFMFAFNPIMQYAGGKVTMCLLLGGVGFFLFGPDALMSSTCAVDFGSKRGAGSAAGLINGLGSTGQIIGLALPGFVIAKYGWGALFTGFGAALLLAALLLLPKWNAVPEERESKEAAAGN